MGPCQKKIPAAKGPPEGPQRAPKIALIQPTEVQYKSKETPQLIGLFSPNLVITNFMQCFLYGPNWLVTKLGLNSLKRYLSVTCTVPHENQLHMNIYVPQSTEWPTSEKNTRCKRPARRAPNPIICSTDLQSCRSCRPKPSQHAEGYYTEYTMATGINFLLLWAHQKTKMGPGPKWNLVKRWRDGVNLFMWKINIPNSPEWPTPEKSTCCKGPNRRAPNVAQRPIMRRGDLETWESNN